ncbi:MAG: FHA domain-containing protein [Eubacteriales bacterium]|nr:FHA domain-containing protein [Eubacteriales bacterium]
MNLQKCENGHFFDADKYQICPHCQKLDDDVKTVGRMENEAPAFGQGISSMPTMPQAPSFAPDDDAKTVGIFQSTLGTGTQPVVGWLVCVQGACQGQSFQLKEGKNFLGRGEDMDVVIRGDMAVARRRHACVIFEPRASVFYAQPGESHELFYLNNNVVLSSEILKSHDVITLGETDLLFVPLCGADFSWDQYKKKEA